MVIKKAQANFDNGETYDVLHYETQVSQVKVLDSSGEAVTSLEELLLKGKVIQSVSLNTVVDTGLYQIKNCTETPVKSAEDVVYLMSIESIGAITKQTFFDGEKNNVYIRSIYNGNVGDWIGVGSVNKDSVDSILKSIGKMSLLATTTTTDLVSAINSLKEETDSHKKGINTLEEQVSELQKHNHDQTYLSLTGGSLKGSLDVANEKSFAGKNTSGLSLNIGKVNGVNDIVIGDATAKTIIQAKSGDITLSDGSNNHKLFHSGNDGAGSGLDADSVDGLEGSQLARKDITNYLQGDQYVEDGKSVVLRASSDSSQAGSLYFRDGSNAQKARIIATTGGDLNIYGGTTLGLTVKSGGETYTTHDHVLNAKDRQVAVRFKLDDKDEGAGFYMNNTTKQVGFYDWKYGGAIFRTDREDQTVKFTNEIFVQGHKVSIQKSAPTGAKTGDVWIGI